MDHVVHFILCACFSYRPLDIVLSMNYIYLSPLFYSTYFCSLHIQVLFFFYFVLDQSNKVVKCGLDVTRVEKQKNPI